jgi:macrolide transport system ATP-binding/permease protein
MSLFQIFRRKTELKEEMEVHLKMATADRIARGESPDEARQAALREFGNVPLIADVTRQRWGWLRFERLSQDLRFAARQLRRSPAFALTAVFVLALGIAACVAIFAFVDAALIKPLPYKSPKQLVMLFESIPLGPRFHLSYPDYLDWKRANKVFTSLDVFAPYGFMMNTPDGLRQTVGARVSAGFFRTLGVAPALGRDFYDSEDRPEAPRTALLSYAAWQKRYGGNPKIVGQSVILDGDPYTIIGVLPRDFSFAPRRAG